MLRTLGQKLGDHQLVLLSRRMDGMLRTESGADVFSKIKTMITDMITTMKENLQAEATKKAYCDKEMGEAAEKKAGKEADLDDVSTKIDATASKSASLKLGPQQQVLPPEPNGQAGKLELFVELKAGGYLARFTPALRLQYRTPALLVGSGQIAFAFNGRRLGATVVAVVRAVTCATKSFAAPRRDGIVLTCGGAGPWLQVVAIKSELTTLAETQANMTALRQEEPETVTGMEGVKSALKTLRDFYKSPAPINDCAFDLSDAGFICNMSSGIKVTSGEREGAAGGVIGRLEDVE
ncbi:BPM3, partial [Symbiodinium sp. CCMP2456]